jgi:hypothetical protein
MLLRIRRTAVIRSIRETSAGVSSGCQAGLEMRVRLEDRHARHSRIVREVAGSGMLAVRIGLIGTVCSMERKCMARLLCMRAR